MRGSRIFNIVQAGFLALLLVHCTSTAELSTSPSPDPSKLWTYITRTNPYQRWQHWPGYEGRYPGISPHGAWIELYANDMAIRAAGSGESVMPYGSILVKENYARDKETLLSITPMYKIRDYNPRAGNWFWAEYSPEGNIRAGGRVQSCIQCHSASEIDYRYTQPVTAR